MTLLRRDAVLAELALAGIQPDDVVMDRVRALPGDARAEAAVALADL